MKAILKKEEILSAVKKIQLTSGKTNFCFHFYQDPNLVSQVFGGSAACMAHIRLHANVDEDFSVSVSNRLYGIICCICMEEGEYVMLEQRKTSLFIRCGNSAYSLPSVEIMETIKTAKGKGTPCEAESIAFIKGLYHFVENTGDPRSNCIFLQMKNDTIKVTTLNHKGIACRGNLQLQYEDGGVMVPLPSIRATTAIVGNEKCRIWNDQNIVTFETENVCVDCLIMTGNYFNTKAFENISYERYATVKKEKLFQALSGFRIFGSNIIFALKANQGSLYVQMRNDFGAGMTKLNGEITNPFEGELHFDNAKVLASIGSIKEENLLIAFPDIGKKNMLGFYIKGEDYMEFIMPCV